MVSTTNLAASNGDVEALKSFIRDGTPPEKLINGSAKKIEISKRGTTADKNNNNNVKGSSFRQIMVAFLANLGTINTGLTFGFSAVAIPQLQNVNSSVFITENQASWVASLSSVGTPCGCILSAYLTDSLGRKWTLFLTEIPSIIGWIMIACAPSVYWIYIGRILTGIGSGMIGAPSRVYTAEVTQPHLRGILSALASVGASLGVALEYALGSLFSWPVLAWLSAIVPVLALVSSLLLPESPSWLITSGKQHKCYNSLKKLRGSTCDVKGEVKDLVAFSERNNCSSHQTAKQKLRAMLHPSALKPFLILTMYFFIYQLSGTNPLTFYAVSIFKDAGTTIGAYLATVLMGLIRFIFTILGCVMMLRVGRRPLTFISSIGCGLTALLLGTYIFMVEYWKKENMEPVATWIPVLTIFLFTAASTVGYLIVPWVMIGEVYPTKVRGLIGGLTTCLCHLFIFVGVKTYPWLKMWFNTYGPFWIYGSLSLIGTIFLYIYLPETKGKTLQEIEENFTRKNKKSDINVLPRPRPIVIKPQPIPVCLNEKINCDI